MLLRCLFGRMTPPRETWAAGSGSPTWRQAAMVSHVQPTCPTKQVVFTFLQQAWCGLNEDLCPHFASIAVSAVACQMDAKATGALVPWCEGWSTAELNDFLRISSEFLHFVFSFFALSSQLRQLRRGASPPALKIGRAHV